MNAFGFGQLRPFDPFSISTHDKQGVTMLDAPVSGGVLAAANATLTFIVGGTEEGMERARPLFMAMGTKAVHCGDAGTGCVAKASVRVRHHG